MDEPGQASATPPPTSPADLTPRCFLLFLAAALFAAFPAVVLGWRTFFYRDFAAMWYPVTVYTRDSLLRGELPLWNPYIHCGVPFQAQMGQWYPPFLVGALLPQPWSTNFQMIAHLFWGGLGVFWLARRWNCSAFAASFAGLGYVFNGVILSSLLWSSYIDCFAWLPWVIGTVMAAWRQGGRWIVLAALASAMQVLSGMPELTLLTWALLGVVWLSDVLGGEAKPWLSAGRTTAVVLVATGLSLVQILPFFDLVAHSQRDRNYATTTWSMPGWGWANLLVPLFHCYRAPQGTWFQAGQDLLPSYYLGVGMVGLALAGALFVRTRLSLVVAVVTLGCYLLALGPNGFVYDWLRRIFPWIGIARFPIKFALLPAFTVPLLAAWALDRWQSSSAEKSAMGRRLGLLLLALLGGIAVLLWAARAHPLASDRWADTATNAGLRVLLLLLMAGGLWLVSKLPDGRARLTLQLGVLAILPIDALTHSPKIAPTLPNAAVARGLWQAAGRPGPPKIGEGRILISPEVERALLYSQLPALDIDFTGKRLAEWYNLNLLDEVPKFNGAMPLRPAGFDRLESYLYMVRGATFGQGLLDFLSIAWTSAPDNAAVFVARTNFLPGITGGQRPRFAADDATFAALISDRFDPRQVVYLPEDIKTAVSVTDQTRVSFTNVEFLPQRIEAEVEAADTSLIVLSQTFYHHWRASLDGQPIPLWRANLAFQAVQVPAGRHRLRLIYRDPNLAIGSGLSALTLLCCAVLWFRWGQRKSGVA